MTTARVQRDAGSKGAPVQRAGAGSTSQGASTPLRQDLRGASFAEGEAMLAPAGDSGPPVQRKGAVQRDESVADAMPENVDLRSARVSFTLPARRKLAGSMLYDATTRYATQVTIEASAQELRVSTSPPLPFDVMFPGANMDFYGAGVRFASGEVYANFHKSGVGFDCTATGRETVVGIISRAIAGTAMARPGYDPLTDRDLTGTLMRVKANFDALPEAQGAGGDGPVAASEVSRPVIGANLAMRTPFSQEGDGAGLRIPAGGQLGVTISGTGDLATILAAGSPQAAAMAAGIRDVAVASEAIELVRNGEAIAKLQRLRIARGGVVSIEQFQMMGGLGAGAGIEMLIRLLAGGAELAGRGVPLEAGIEITARSGRAEPELVRGVSRQMIEQGLTAAVQTLLRDNRNAVPGLDLALVFGVGA